MATATMAIEADAYTSSRVMTPAVYRLAALRTYTQIPAAVQSRTQDLQWTDSHGSTALHLLCQARSITAELIEAVEACLLVLPQAVQWSNAASWTPMHFAVSSLKAENDRSQSHDARRAHMQLILILIRACPTAVKARATIGFQSKTAFHTACEGNADITILKEMLLTDPSLASNSTDKSSNARTLKQSTNTYSMGKRIVRTNLADTPLHSVWSAGRSAEKMALLLEAACAGRVSVRRRLFQPPFPVLHAAMTIECPRQYVSQILSKSRCHAVDENGYIPLHLILKQSKYSSYHQFCLCLLLKAAPETASIPDPETRQLPLHIAIQNEMTWYRGVKEIVYSYPMALRVKDPISNMVPSCAAATYAYTKDELTTVFELLTAAPDMLACNNRCKSNV